MSQKLTGGCRTSFDVRQPSFVNIKVTGDGSVSQKLQAFVTQARPLSPSVAFVTQARPLHLSGSQFQKSVGTFTSAFLALKTGF